MSYVVSTFAVGSTGNHSVTALTFLPKGLRFTISAKAGASETSVAHLSTGFTDGTNQVAHSILADTTANDSKAYTDRCVNHYARVAGTLTEVIKASFVSFDTNGGGVFGFTLNFTAADANYDIHFEAFA